MAAIRSKDTKPERTVRALLRSLGYPGYRLHRRDLPGTPDVAFLRRRKVIFVHGCFWHGHDCETGNRKPKTNQDYWLPKVESTRQRDAMNYARLREMGWRILLIWECELHPISELAEVLEAFMQEA